MTGPRERDRCAAEAVGSAVFHFDQPRSSYAGSFELSCDLAGGHTGVHHATFTWPDPSTPGRTA